MCKQFCYATRGSYNLRFERARFLSRIQKGIIKVRVHNSGDVK